VTIRPAVQARQVTVEYRLVHERSVTLKEAAIRLLKGRRMEVEHFRALDSIDLEVPKGQTLGLIGSNGSGKTTTLRLLAGVLRPTSGTLHVEGRVSTLIELGAGFDPELSGAENVYLAGAFFGYTRAQMSAKFERIVQFAELERFIDVPVKNYSAGMSARLGFSIATDVDPQVLLIDEVLAVGDASFYERCLRRMHEFRQAGKTIIFASHDLHTIAKFCDRVVLLERGRLVADGEPGAVVARYRGGPA
jgi:ABC-type polysaccharide/polyol phosphate transport system ATPase subunit